VESLANGLSRANQSTLAEVQRLPLDARQRKAQLSILTNLNGVPCLMAALLAELAAARDRWPAALRYRMYCGAVYCLEALPAVLAAGLATSLDSMACIGCFDSTAQTLARVVRQVGIACHSLHCDRCSAHLVFLSSQSCRSAGSMGCYVAFLTRATPTTIPTQPFAQSRVASHQLQCPRR